MDKDILEVCMTVALSIANASVIILLLAAWISRVAYEKLHTHVSDAARGGTTCCGKKKKTTQTSPDSPDGDDDDNTGIAMGVMWTGQSWDPDASPDDTSGADTRETLVQFHDLTLSAQSESSIRGASLSYHENINPLALKSREKTAQASMTVAQVESLVATIERQAAEIRDLKALGHSSAGAVKTLDVPPSTPTMTREQRREAGRQRRVDRKVKQDAEKAAREAAQHEAMEGGGGGELQRRIGAVGFA
jgi:hypothetical protein